MRVLALFVAAAAACSVVGAHRVDATTTIPVYLFAGQSNMTGFSAYTHELATVAPDLTRPTKNVEFYGPLDDSASRWATLQAPTEVKGAMYHSGFGPELSAARALTRLHPNTEIAIVKYARNGTNLYNQWNPKTNMYYSLFITRVRSAVADLRKKSNGAPVKIAGLFWMQGESDSDSRAHAQAYGGNLTAFIGSVRRDLGTPQLPVVIGQISDIGLVDRTFRYSYIVRQQEQQVADADPYAFLAYTAGLAHSPQSPIHYSTRGTVDLGYRFVQPSFRL